MFLGDLIHERRLKKQLTQSELAAGICTQNTISKIEKKQIPPTIPILTKICLRLDLTLNDLFTEFNSIDTATDQNTINAEIALLNGHTQLALDCIQPIDFASSQPNTFPPIFYFFQGYTSFLNQQSELQVFSAYNSFTAAIGDEASTLKLLLNTGMGLIYQQADEPLAEFYFNKNLLLIQHLDHLNNVDLHRVLFTIYHTAQYLLASNQNKVAKKLLETGIELSQKHHFIDQLAQILALKAKTLGKNTPEYAETLTQALVFAKFLEDDQLSTEIEQLQS